MSIIISTLAKTNAIIETGAASLGVVQVPTIENPFPGAPNFTVFGTEFDTWWKKLFAAGWALGLIVAGFYLVVGFLAMAKSESDNPHAHAEGKKKATGAGIGFIALASLAVIMGAILTLVGTTPDDADAKSLGPVSSIELTLEG